MSLLQVTYLDLLHELCLQRGYAILLTAHHCPPGFAKPSRTLLRTLDVVEPATVTADGLTMRKARARRIREGDLIARCPLDTVDGDLQVAAALLVRAVSQSSPQQ